jgi:hypothetical protein
MADPTAEPGATPRAESHVCEEIGRAVGSLWRRRSGIRPASVSTEYVGDVVRCTIKEGDAPEMTELAEDAEPKSDSIGAGGYQHHAQAAVARLTGRHVVGFVAKDVKGDTAATNAFILEATRRKY